MIKYFSLISFSLLFFQTACMANSGFSMENLMDSTQCEEYNLRMQFRGHEITGICVINKTNDSNLVGTVINEFGMKAFDFVYSNGKIKLINIISFLDKWYIRKVLKKDLSFIFTYMPKGIDFERKYRRISFKENGEVEVVNKKFVIIYSFIPLKGES